MSARDDYPWLGVRRDAYIDSEPDCEFLGAEAYRALNELDALRAELVGLRVRTLTASEATKLLVWQSNEAASLIHEALAKGYIDADWREEAEEVWRSLVDAMQDAARVAGETGDAP